jgi:hypothetical protein
VFELHTLILSCYSSFPVRSAALQSGTTPAELVLVSGAILLSEQTMSIRERSMSSNRVIRHPSIPVMYRLDSKSYALAARTLDTHRISSSIAQKTTAPRHRLFAYPVRWVSNGPCIMFPGGIGTFAGQLPHRTSAHLSILLWP